MKKENLTATIVRTLIENARAQRKNIIENIDDEDRKSTRLNSSHMSESRMPSSA